MNALTGTLLVARQSFRRAFRGPRVLWLGLVTLLPLLLALLQSSHRRGGDFETFAVTTLFFTLQAIVPFLGLMLGVSIFGDEVEGRTLTYLFTRPLPRPVFYVGRLLGMGAAFAIVVGVTTWGATLIYGRNLDLAPSEVRGAVAAAVGGFVAYLAFFAALRVLFRRALFVGFILAFMFEGAISKLPQGNVGQISIWHQSALIFLRGMEHRELDPEAIESIGSEETAGEAWRVLVAVFLVSTAVGAWFIHRRETPIPAATS